MVGYTNGIDIAAIWHDAGDFSLLAVRDDGAVLASLVPSSQSISIQSGIEVIAAPAPGASKITNIEATPWRMSDHVNTLDSAGEVEELDIEIPWNTPPVTPTVTTVSMSPLTGVTQLAAWKEGALALKTNGTVSTFVDDPWFFGPSMVVQISGQFRHVLLRDADGKVWAAGEDDSGALGLGGQTSEPTPVALNLSDATDIVAGYSTSFAIRADGSWWSWGENNCGQLDDLSNFSGVRQTLTLPEAVVLNPGTDLNDWLKQHFSPEQIGSIDISGDEVDPDLDGFSNLLEYSLGTDPTVPESSSSESSSNGLDVKFETLSSEALTATEAGGGGASGLPGDVYFTAAVVRPAGRTDIGYIIEFSNDMENWSSDPSRYCVVADIPIILKVRDTVPARLSARHFARLRVVRKN